MNEFNYKKMFKVICNQKNNHFFSSDMSSLEKNQKFEYVLMILKVRVSDVILPLKRNIKKKGKKKIGKAEKKRLASEKMAKGDLIFDNCEESLLFKVKNFFKFNIHTYKKIKIYHF